MGWVKYTGPHTCDRPSTAPMGKTLKDGMVWQCDRCNKGWRVKYWSDMRGESGITWEAISAEAVEAARAEQAAHDAFDRENRPYGQR